jgi:hypothetical protein
LRRRKDSGRDGKTMRGPWAIMTPGSWVDGIGRTGTGFGQKYEKQANWQMDEDGGIT